ncbi:hypothetical protein CPT_Muenster_031 [Klebsiella phage Muenster]|nr:hypothetical protein CPT_Muenster_031 [Klebsiella phage Muenster]
MKEYIFEVTFTFGPHQLIRSSGYNREQAFSNLRRMYPSVVTWVKCEEA